MFLAVIQIVLAILYFIHLPLLVAVPGWVFALPLILWAVQLGFVLFWIVACAAVALIISK
jgi:hypothetical protein